MTSKLLYTLLNKSQPHLKPQLLISQADHVRHCILPSCFNLNIISLKMIYRKRTQELFLNTISRVVSQCKKKACVCEGVGWSNEIQMYT